MMANLNTSWSILFFDFCIKILQRLRFHLKGVKLYLTEVRNLHHYRRLSFHPERVNLSKLNKNFHIHRRLQFYTTYRIADAFNFYPKDKPFYTRFKACIAANIFQLFPKKKNLRQKNKFNFSIKTKNSYQFRGAVRLEDSSKVTSQLLCSRIKKKNEEKKFRDSI